MNDRKAQLNRKLRSYRSARAGSIFLAVVSALVLVMSLATGRTDSDIMGPAYSSTFFWPAMAYICHLKIKLIQGELSQ